MYERSLLVLEIGSLDLQWSALISWGILIIFRSLRRKKRVKESEVLKTSSHKLTACWESVSVILRAFNWFCQYCLGNASICTGSCSLWKLAFLCWEWWVARVGGWPLVSRAVLSTTCVGKKKKGIICVSSYECCGVWWGAMVLTWMSELQKVKKTIKRKSSSHMAW